MSIGFFKTTSTDAFRERIQSSIARKKAEEDRYVGKRCKKPDPHACAIRRKVDDIKLAKQLGISLSELE